MKTIKIEVPEGKNAKWVNGVLILVDEKDNRPVTERVKTFEDACRYRGIEPKKWLEYNDTEKMYADVLAYLKLRIIASALNEGWEPKFTTDEYRYYPWFRLYTQKEIDKMDEEKKKSLVRFGGRSRKGSYFGLFEVLSDDAWPLANSCISARLVVKTKELAYYFGQQFLDIWADYVLNQR